MRRIVYPGGLYCVALPDGGRAVLFPGQRIDTSDGDVPLPGEDVLGLVGTRVDGVLMLAGQGQRTGAAWLWDGAQWRSVATTFGVGPCAFGPGALYVAISASRVHIINLRTGETFDQLVAIGTQGIRYIEDGTPIPGDATLVDDPQHPTLHEFTTRGNVTVGQGHEANALINGRVLEAGNASFIHFDRDGDRLAIALVQLDTPSRGQHRSVVLWLTVAEIAALPLPTAPAPPPAPVPVPPPVPEPVPMPVPFDFSATLVLDSPVDLASWAETATITRVEFSSGRFVVDFDRRTGSGKWPEAKKAGDPDTQYTLGLCCQIGPRWYASGVVQFWDNRELEAGGGVDEIGATWFYDGRWGSLEGHQPARGELVGVFVGQGNLRGGRGATPLHERSRVLLVTWGTNYTGVPVDPPPSDPPPPNPPPSDLTDILRRLAALETTRALPRRIALRTEDGHYLCAENGGSGEVNATRAHPGGWETFTVEPQ